MRELHRGSLPDGSLDFGKRLARILPPSLATALLITSCGGEKNPNQNVSDSGPERASTEEQYGLPFTAGETWFLTNGPHADGYSKGIPYGVDIAPPEGGFCPEDGKRFTIENRTITASASGQVIVAGKDNDRNDPYHSEVRIKDKNGLTQVYIHLDKTKVKVGDKVKQGAPLGSPSCEYPPGGKNTGPHLHIGLMKDRQAIPIDGVQIGGWTIHEGVNGKDGTMTKPGEKTRTADTGRYGENNTGIRNDLPNPKTGAVVALPKDPNSQISGKPNEKLAQEKWQTFRSSLFSYEVQYPFSWNTQSKTTEFGRWDIFQDNNLDSIPLTVTRTPADSAATLDSYATSIIENQQKTWGYILDKQGISLTVTKTERLIANLPGRVVKIHRPPNINDTEGSTTVNAFFIETQPDGSRKLWNIQYFKYRKATLPVDQESILNHFLDTFKLTQNSSSEKQAEFLTHVSIDPKMPYKIDYPKDLAASSKRYPNNAINEYFIPNTGSVEGLQSISVVCQPVGSKTTVNDYKNFILSDPSHITGLQNITGLAETPNLTVDGQNSLRLDYTFRVFVKDWQLVPYHGISYLVIKDGRAWRISFTMEASDFQAESSQIERMISSFKFLQ